MSKDGDPERTVYRPAGPPPSGASAAPPGWRKETAARPPGEASPTQGWPASAAPAPADFRDAADRRRESGLDDALANAPAPPVEARPGRRSASASLRLPLLGGVGLLLAAAVAAAMLWPDTDPPRAIPGRPPEGLAAGRHEAPSTGSPEAAVIAALPTVECAWLTLSSAQAETGGLAMFFRGAAGYPVKAQNHVEAAAERAGGRLAQIDFSAVAQIHPELCGAIDSYSRIRDPGVQRLSMPGQSVWEIAPQELETDEGRTYAQPLIEVNIGNPGADFALFGLEGTSGRIDPIVSSRTAFDSIESSTITRLPNDRFRLNLATGHTGWSGILLVTGRGPFDPAPIVAAGSPAGGAGQFAALAAERGWKTEMLWYKVVDELPN
jgi:serine/threonine-protein kinase